TEMTFKEAIAQNTTAINKGFIFGVGEGSGEKGTHYLGDKLIIKAGAIDKPTTITTSEDGYSPNNIKTHYEKNSKNILIGIKDKPTFKNVIIENGIPEDEEELKKGNYDKHAVNKKYLDKRLEKVAANFTVKGDNPKDGKGYTLDKEHNELNINGDSENITTAVVDNKGIKISLNKELKGITSIANNDTKIELNNGTGGNGTKSIVFTAGNSDKKVTLTEDKFSGVSEIGKDENAKITFNSNGQKEIDFKVGTNTTYKFTDSGLDLAGKPITNLGSGLGNGAGSGNNDIIEKILSGNPDGANGSSTISNNAVNVKDLSEVAKAIVGKGLTFAGNTGSEFTRELGSKITIKGDGMDLTSKAENDAITFTLNKATSVDKDDEKVVTSKAVAEKLQEYTSTATLGKDFLKVTGENIGNDETSKAEGRKKFGGNVGIAEIKLGDTEKSSTELVQADAVIKYLKGTGTDSVKISDSTKTMAKGNYSISIGHEAVSENESAIAIGYGANAKNRNALALGRDSEVLGEHATAIGFQNKVSGNHSGAFGKQNTVKGEHSYAVGAYNEIGGEHTYVLGSSVTTDDKVKNAVILGNQSTGVSDAVSVGSADKQRRIVYVADPKNQYDAVNKQYVDALGLKFKGNDDKNIHRKLSETLEIVGKGLNKNQTTKFNGTNGNIAVKENKGKLEISLNRDLKGIKSISDSKNKNIATEIRFNRKNDTNSISNSLITNLTISSNGGTFEFNRTGLHINNKQITGLRSGLLEKHNGQDGERKDLDYLIGKDFDKSSIKTHAVNVGDLAKISKEIVEKGYKYKADIPSNNSNDTSIKLGSTISIVKWTDTPATGQPAVTVGTGTTSQTSAVKYTGDNLTTRYTYVGGNAKIEIGFNESPTFKAVMLDEDQTYNGGNVGDSKELITKGYLEKALDSFKFNVANGDGTTYQIGRNDTLKFNAGLNIQLTLAKEGEKPANGTTSTINSSAVTSTPAPTPTAPAVASSSDSSEPASTSSGSAGGAVASGGINGDSADTVVASSSPTAGTSSTTTTTPSDTSTPTTTTPTTAVVTIGTTEDLKNITSISSKPKAGSAGGNGAGSTGEVTKLTLDPTDGATFQVGSQGAKVNINDKGIALMPQGASGMNNPNAESPSITINAGTKPADPNSLESFEKGQEPSITFSTKKTSDGNKTIGSGKITGLADIKPEETDGTLAANKNYVDEKVSDLNNNRPFDFYLGNEKVVKGADGSFHKDGKPSEKLSEEEKKQVVIKAEPSTAPIGISNVASGLGITTPTDEQKEK
ncbi:hypothetical protein E1290_09325, partial [Histophilus somni]